MDTRKIDSILRHWREVLVKEAHDLAALQQVRERALRDSAVRDHPTLPRLLRAAFDKRRAELEQESQTEASSTVLQEPQPSWRSEVPAPEHVPTPNQDLRTFKQLAQTLCAALDYGDVKETEVIFAKVKGLQEKSPEVIPAAMIGEYEQRVEQLRIRVEKLADEVAVLTKEAVAASRGGSEQDLARSMRRLTAVHVAHPYILDTPGLERIREDVSAAAEERREHQRISKKLLGRERAISTEIKALATVVRDFHQASCTVPLTSDGFHTAEAAYLRAIQHTRAYDPEWFSEVVLELAGLLAEWTVPPTGAEGQIDRFLDSISAGLDRIRAEMHQIKSMQESDELDD